MGPIDRISTAGAPVPLGAYPHAVRAGGFVFCSGQGSRDPETGREAGIERGQDGAIAAYDIRAQADACLRNLARVLDAAGASWDSLVEVNVYLKDMGDFEAMNEVYRRHFPDGGPARTTLAVADLPGDNYIEIRATALA